MKACTDAWPKSQPHHTGTSPLWLALDQVRAITLNEDEALINCAKLIVNELRPSVTSTAPGIPKARKA